MFALLEVRLGDVGELVGLETMLDELAVLFFVAHDYRTRIGFDDLAGDSELLDLHVIAVS